MSQTYRCDCGDWSGEPCQWTGPASDMVIVEWMPDAWRASHTAAGNSGRFPGNGALRAAVEQSCAEMMVETEGEWVRIIAEDAAAVAKTATSDAHRLRMYDDFSGEEWIDFASRPTADEIAEACRDWVEGGEWGDCDPSVRVSWTLTDAADKKIDAGSEDVDIDADDNDA